ncbi:MAG: hypothetical protein NC335_02935 [Bacteroides sp.]|nr:hypothetical protein [Bacteroides sp.]
MKIFNGNTELIDIEVNDESYRYRAIRGEHNLTLYFSLAEYMEIPVGAHCEYQGETFTLYSLANVKMQHSRNFEYTVVFEAAQAEARMLKFRNPVDGRLKFSLTATPAEFLAMFISNMERISSEWKTESCIQAEPKTISFNHTSCADALSQIADEFGTEYEIKGRNVSLHKVEYNKTEPLALSYGKGNGFKPGIGRTNYNRESPIGVLYVQGGSRNIDASKNGGLSELLLPKARTIRFDGTYFEDEQGFDEQKARTYETDAEGLSVMREEAERIYISEDSLDCSEIYPSRLGTVSGVRFIYKGHIYDKVQKWSDEEWKEVLIDIIDTDIPESLDYNEFRIDGEKISVIFQDGMLAGKEFDANYFHQDNGGKPKRRFELVQQDIDGIKMPGGVFIPQAGQKFVVLGCSVPQAYICDNNSKSGASWDMFKKGVRHLYENEEPKFTFSGQLDGIWAKNNWENIGGKIKPGGFVLFSDTRFQKQPVLIRITGIKDYVNNPHSPEIELSNSVIGHSFSGTLQKIESSEAEIEERHKESRQFTKRRFRDSEEAVSMLKEAMLEGFSDSVSPLTVQTMMNLVGDKSLQFRFVDNIESPKAVAHDIHYDNERKVLVCDAGIIQHMTFDVNGISPSHDSSEYRFWGFPSFESPVMDDPDKKYYLYAKVSKEDNSGVFHLSEKAIPMEPEKAIEDMEDWQSHYFLLVGFLSSEYNGERSYASWYGFTEIVPGQVLTDVIRDADGRLVIDLSQATITAKDGAKIEGSLNIGAGSSGLSNLDEWSAKQEQMDRTENAIISNRVISVIEKRELRRRIKNLIQLTSNEDIPEFSVIKEEKTAAVPAIPKIKVTTSKSSSWREVTAGMTNNGNSMNDYIGWVASNSIESSLTTQNTLYIYNNSDIAVEVIIEFQSDGESSFDYLMVGALDQTATPTAGTASTYDFDTKGRQNTIISKTYTVPRGTHTLKMVYRKDGSVNTGTDSAYYRIVSIPADQEAVPEVPATYIFQTQFGNVTGGAVYERMMCLNGKEWDPSEHGKFSNMKVSLINAYDLSLRDFDLWTDENTDINPDSRNAFNSMLLSAENYLLMLSDISYLQRTFGPGVDAEGAVLGKLVGVKDKFGNVVAGLNGSEMGRDDSHGKILFFGGTDRATDTELRNADTKIYEDGTIESDKIIGKKGCKFGEWEIKGYGTETPMALASERKASHADLIFRSNHAILTKDLVSLEEHYYPDRDNPTDERSHKRIMMATGIQGYQYDGCLFAEYAGDNKPVTGIHRRIGVFSSVKGELDNTLAIDKYNGNFAFYAENGDLYLANGVINGFAAKKKVFENGAQSMTPEYLYYHSWGDASYLYLPANAPIGTIFFVEKPYNNTRVTIYAPSGEILRSIPQNKTGQNLVWSSSHLFIIVQKFNNTEWYGLQLDIKQ